MWIWSTYLELVFFSYYVSPRYPNPGCHTWQQASILTETSCWVQILRVLMKRNQKKKDSGQGVLRDPLQLVALWRTQEASKNWKEHTTEKRKVHLPIYTHLHHIVWEHIHVHTWVYMLEASASCLPCSLPTLFHFSFSLNLGAHWLSKLVFPWAPAILLYLYLLYLGLQVCIAMPGF